MNAKWLESIFKILGALFIHGVSKYDEAQKAKLVETQQPALLDEIPKAVLPPAPPTNPYAGIVSATLFSDGLEATVLKVKEQAATDGLDEAQLKEAVKQAVHPAVVVALEDGVLSDEEEKRIESLMAAFGLDEADYSQDTIHLMAKGALIRDLLEGTYKEHIKVSNLPFNFMKSEKLVWVFQNVPMWELKTVSKFIAGSQGVSIRVARGLYWRVGKVAGERVSSEEMHSLGYNHVAVTTKHVYFTNGTHSKRIRHEKIISIAPSADGPVIVPDGARAKPIYFYVDDDWFFLNVMQNATNWA